MCICEKLGKMKNIYNITLAESVCVKANKVTANIQYIIPELIMWKDTKFNIAESQ